MRPLKVSIEFLIGGGLPTLTDHPTKSAIRHANKDGGFGVGNNHFLNFQILPRFGCESLTSLFRSRHAFLELGFACGAPSHLLFPLAKPFYYRLSLNHFLLS